MQVGNLLTGGNYLKAADVPSPMVVTIRNGEVKQLPGESRPKVIVNFAELPKGMVLNVTNGAVLTSNFGDDTDAWPGQRIKIFQARTVFQGREVPCLRLALPDAPPGVAPPAMPTATGPPPPPSPSAYTATTPSPLMTDQHQAVPQPAPQQQSAPEPPDQIPY